MFPAKIKYHILKIKYLYLVFLLCFSVALQAQVYQQAGIGNPLIPGYFADPTVRKFGDTYYIYATTDGNGGGYGPSQVWMSKDFVNWSLQDMNWPTTRYYWAPDVTKGNDGKFYLYYCQPVEIFGASSSSPVGPWTSLLPEEKPIVPNFLVPNVITLDGQTFRDDDGKFYMYWGTWGIYPDHGCGVGLMNDDMKSFAKLAQIPNTVAKDFFEAPFMFKRNGIYYLTYSSGRCEDGTYRVQYVMSKTGPMGPFTYGKNNPIIATNDDGSVHGPGHQSVLQEVNAYYMVYHRHNNPNSGGGFHRQIVADKMEFDSEGNILKIEPSHDGIGFLAKNENPYANLALMAKTTASSSYSNDFKSSFAIDDNNGTLWKPKDNVSEAWLRLDLGKVSHVKSVHTQFEYATWFYQYQILTSLDGKVWKTYADRTKNTIHGSPMIDPGDVKARYIKIKITNTEYPGINKAIWNIKVYDNDSYKPLAKINAPKDNIQLASIPQGLLVDLNANNLEIGNIVSQWRNNGKLQGLFSPFTAQAPIVGMVAGKKALFFSGKTVMKSDFTAPTSLKGNGSFTVATWVYNPTIEDEEPIISWTKRGGIDLSNGGLGYGSNKKWGAATHWGWADMAYKKVPEAGKWHHIALVFDGTMEKLYINGILEKEERKMLFVNNLDKILLGSTTDGNAYFSGALASLKLYDIPLGDNEVKKLASTNFDSKIAYYFDASNLEFGKLTEWKNEGKQSGSLKGTANLSAVGGLAAVALDEKDKLEFNQPSNILKKEKPYTIVSPIYGADVGNVRISWPNESLAGTSYELNIKGTGVWQYVVHVFDGIKHQTYIDGIAVAKPMIKSVNTGMPKLMFRAAKKDAAIASFAVYNYVYQTAVIKTAYQTWKAQHPKQQFVVDFDRKPIAITPHIVLMSAKANNLPGDVVKYTFIDQTYELEHRWSENNNFYSLGLTPNQKYAYKVVAIDNFGNIAQSMAFETVSTQNNQFQIFETSVMRDHDFVATGVNGTSWDGIVGNPSKLQQKDGLLNLASTATHWDGSASKGPFLYKNIKGDFVAEVNIADLSGLAENKVMGANDAGLMVRSTTGDFNLIQNSVLLGWGIGNMVTDFGSNGRKQTNNNTAFSFYKYLQIERLGNIFYARASRDGKNWKELPGGIIKRNDMDGKIHQVGIYQASYGKQEGFARFKDFTITQKK